MVKDIIEMNKGSEISLEVLLYGGMLNCVGLVLEIPNYIEVSSSCSDRDFNSFAAVERDVDLSLLRLLWQYNCLDKHAGLAKAIQKGNEPAFHFFLAPCGCPRMITAGLLMCPLQ